MDTTNAGTPVRVVGRYALYAEIAAGGMATVHFGRLLGPVGFSRTVAIKRLHPQFAKDPEFVSMFLDEARVAARIRHPNVVPTLDVVATQGELFLVMEYVQGESLARLLRTCRERNLRMPPRMVATVIAGALHGLHAAHEARNERGEPLGIVHRDVSPHNILVGTDGVPRVLDFGVAKATGRIQTTREGQLKGKIAYMAPEQLSNEVSRQTDVYAASICLWEALSGQRLFTGDHEAAILTKVLQGTVDPPSRHMTRAGEALDPQLRYVYEKLDELTLRGLAQDPKNRWATAREMAIALERIVGLAPASELGEYVEHSASDILHKRAVKIAEIESSSSVNLTGLPAFGGDDAHGLGDTLRDPGSMPSRAPAPSVSDFTRGDRASHPAGAASPENSQLSSVSLSKQSDGGPSRHADRRMTALLVGLVATLGIGLIAAIAVLVVVRRPDARPEPSALASPKALSTVAVAEPPPAIAPALDDAGIRAATGTLDSPPPPTPPASPTSVTAAPTGRPAAFVATARARPPAAPPPTAPAASAAAAPVVKVPPQPCTSYFENGIKKYRGNCE